MPAQEVLCSPGNPAAVSHGDKDLGQRFCVPAFRLVCLFQARSIIGKKMGALKLVIVISLPISPMFLFSDFWVWREMTKVTACEAAHGCKLIAKAKGRGEVTAKSYFSTSSQSCVIYRFFWLLRFVGFREKIQANKPNKLNKLL